MTKYEVIITERRSFTIESDSNLDSDALYEEAKDAYMDGAETKAIDMEDTIFDDILQVNDNMKTRKDVWDMHDKLRKELGDELFLDEICKGLSVDNAVDLYEYIARNHDIDFDDDD